MGTITNLKTVSNDYQLDNALIGPSAQRACVVSVQKWVNAKPISAGGKLYPAFTKPIGALLKYISKKYIPTGTSSSHTFEKKMGYSSEFSVSAEVKATVSANILRCESSLEVTTGFEYKTGISAETTESWTTTVQGPANFFVYQPMLVYCTRLLANASTSNLLSLSNTPFVKRNGEIFFLSMVYRDSPQTLNKGINPIDATEFKNYLLSDAWKTWYSDVALAGKGHLQHVGSSKYVVARDSTGAGGNGNPLVLWDGFGSQAPSGNAYNKFILTKDGYLYHQGSGKYVVAKDSTGRGGNDNPLVLWDGYSSQAPSGDGFNKFVLKNGHLYHQGSGRYVVARDSTGRGGNDNPLVLWDGFGSQAPSGNNFNVFKFDGA